MNEALPPTLQTVVSNILARAVDEEIVAGEARDLIEHLWPILHFDLRQQASPQRRARACGMGERTDARQKAWTLP